METPLLIYIFFRQSTLWGLLWFVLVGRVLFQLWFPVLVEAIERLPARFLLPALGFFGVWLLVGLVHLVPFGVVRWTFCVVIPSTALFMISLQMRLFD